MKSALITCFILFTIFVTVNADSISSNIISFIMGDMFGGCLVETSCFDIIIPIMLAWFAIAIVSSIVLSIVFTCCGCNCPDNNNYDEGISDKNYGLFGAGVVYGSLTH